MIDYKSTSTSDNSIIERVSSAKVEGTISLTWLWEVILRTKRLPEDLEPQVLFLVLRDRLRNPEREVRLNALRVLADLIPVIERQFLDSYMEVLQQDLIANLSYVAPSVRKGAVDVVRTNLKYSLQPNEILRKLLTEVPQDSHLMLGLFLASPYLIHNNYINEDTTIFVLKQLFDGLEQENLKEAALGALVKIRQKFGADRFNLLLNKNFREIFENLCKEENILLDKTSKPFLTDDNVILETEITLEKGPAITMQIHEETSKIGANDFSDSDDDFRRRGRSFVRMVTDDSESEMINRSPRKVHFGGEVVKMRTPESDSNQPSDNDMQTSVIIDRPTSIKITVSDNVASIKTRHKSMIPVRITTGSNPSTPSKRINSKKKRLHKSAPELRKIDITNSKIPLRENKKYSDQSQSHEYLVAERNMKKHSYIIVDSTYNSNFKKTTNKNKSAQTQENGLQTSSNGIQIQPNNLSVPMEPNAHKDAVVDVQVQSPNTTTTNGEQAQNSTSKSLITTAVESVTIVKSPVSTPNLQVVKSPNLQKSPVTTPNLEIKSNNRIRRGSSPVPTHREVEMLHNLARSPIPPKEPEIEIIQEPTTATTTATATTYDSFQVCKKEDEKNTKTEELIIENIIKDLNSKDLWVKTRNLDDLTTILQENPSVVNTNNIKPLLQVLFSCEQNYRIQNRAQEAIQLIVLNMDANLLEETMELLATNLVKIGSPFGIRLALLLMQRTSPRKFLDSLKVTEPKEKILRIIIAMARTFPSSEINVERGVQLAFEGMKDSKRQVKQAALEALASLAQVSGNGKILDSISELAKNQDNFEYLLRVVRTRLSRKQLPMVDLNGNVRYSSPREQEEFDWLCGGSISIRKTMSLGSIKVPPTNQNYWKHNSRHDLEGYVDNFGINRSLDVSETSNDESSAGEGNGGSGKERIWAIDGTNFPPLDNVGDKSSLFPVYVLRKDNHSKPQNGKNRNFDRGRSNSPPSNRQQDSNKSKRFFKHHDHFRKSFSSEQIYANVQNTQEPSSFSLSSRSSTISTGSSTKSGIWLKDFRSGIPIPINSTDMKLKLRYNRQNSESFNGPLIAQESVNITKLESAQTSPMIHRNSPQQVQTLQQPPRSSGSESSGYFTPPPEHHLKDQVLERFISEDTLEEVNNNNNNHDGPSPEPPNFQVITDSEASDNPDVVSLRQSSASSAAISEEPEKIDNSKDEIDQRVTTPISQFNLDDNSRSFIDQRSKSRSEINLQIALPEIERKNINSAPPLNEIINLNVVPYRYPPDTSPTSPIIKTSLPGSIDSCEHTPTKQSDDDTPKRLSRRGLYSRGSLRRSDSSKPVEIRPYNRPREALLQGLNQMDSSEWETTIQGLNCLTRIARNHPEVLELQMHTVCAALAKNIKNLRSQVARAACRAASEIFATCRKGLEMELEELAGPLLQRTADTNKFLRSDANAALDVMSLNLSIPRVVSVIANKGATHQNCVVRAASTRLISDIAGRIGAEKVYNLPKDTRDKFWLIGATGLTEGSLDIRKYAKSLMGTLNKHPQFQRILLEVVPPHIIRHITKALNALK